ncbi:MAG: transposase [Myxococcota bacterium]
MTWSCEKRLALFGNADIRAAFVASLDAARRRLGFALYAYVVMPEHVHLLVKPDLEVADGAAIAKGVKAPFASSVLKRWRELDAPVLVKITGADGVTRFWQRGGGHDRNVRDREEFDSIVRYVHENPVKRGLVGSAEEWVWSSARWYAGDRDGGIGIDRVV